jgi:3-dehydroquinate synthetase
VRNAGGWRPLLDTKFDRHHPIGPVFGRLAMGRGLTLSMLTEALRVVGSGGAAVIADRAVLDANPSLSSALPGERMCVTDGGERAKTMRHLEELLTWLAAMNVERSDPLLVVGGGTLGDVGGLAAALHRRGIPLAIVPTTWLAQADSAIGGKVAIDLPTAKNGVGAFWPPSLIVEDASLLHSLPLENRRDGLAECVKAGLIGDPSLWQLIEDRGSRALVGEDEAGAYAITERAVLVKLAIVEHDPFESGERRKLNLGHTIGHALEVESGYVLGHGTAVALGLRAVARMASERGAARGLADRIDSVLGGLGFPLRQRFDRAVVLAALGGDKKRFDGVQRWILPVDVGEVVEIDDVSPQDVEAALDAIAE